MIKSLDETDETFESLKLNNIDRFNCFVESKAFVIELFETLI